MDMICDACGATNRPGAEFCVQCNAFLAWDESAAGAPRPGTGPAPSTGTPSPGVSTPTSTTTASTVVQAAQETTVPQPAVTTTATVTYAPVGQPCPTCGLVNPPELRFCAHCGYGFASSVPEQPGVPVAFVELSAAAADRAARRDYRRSLPPLYRWRRVLIGVAVAALVLAGAVWVRHPVVAARDGWYRVTKSYVRVTPVVASVDPPGLTAPGADPAALVDQTVREWTETWQPTGAIACGAAPGTADVVLTFPPTRIRQLQIVPGLDKTNPKRSLQPLPAEIGITYPGGRCQRAVLAQGDLQQPIRADSGIPVTSVRIGINAVYPAGPDVAPQVSITEIVLQSYPH